MTLAIKHKKLKQFVIIQYRMLISNKRILRYVLQIASRRTQGHEFRFGAIQLEIVSRHPNAAIHNEIWSNVSLMFSIESVDYYLVGGPDHRKTRYIVQLLLLLLLSKSLLQLR